MAGIVVADTIQNGAGTSTSMDNAIYGSAKAWVSYNLSTQTINASYNVSSVTYNATGDFTVNFTNAFSDTKYAPMTNLLNSVGFKHFSIINLSDDLGTFAYSKAISSDLFI